MLEGVKLFWVRVVEAVLRAVVHVVVKVSECFIRFFCFGLIWYFY